MKYLFLLFFFICKISFAENFTQIYVPNPPGGVTDSMARLIANELSKTTEKITVINIPGALGGEAFRRAYKTKNPSIYGLGEKIINPIIHGKDNVYDIRGNFSENIMIGYSPVVITVRASIPVNNIREFEKFVRTSIPDLKYAGGGAVSNVSAIEFMNSIRLTGRKISYKGGIEAAMSVATGETDFYFGNLNNSIPHIQSLRVRAIAVNTPTRLDIIPNVPTVFEQMGLSYKAQGIFGIAIPNSVDQETRKLWRGIILEVVKTKEFTENLKRVGIIKIDPVIEGVHYNTWIVNQQNFYESMVEKYYITN